ncbi:unnamed protein product [Sympodiomycopsis kandeliae]
MLRAQEAAKTPLVQLLTILCLSLGLPSGWSITFTPASRQPTRWSQEDLATGQPYETLSQFARRFKRKGRVALSFGGLNTSINAADPAILPWIRAEEEAGGPCGYSRGANKEAEKRRGGLQGIEEHIKSCALSHFATRWDAAHLVPHRMSGAPFTWMLASLQRCLELAQGTLPDVLLMVDAVLQGLTADVIQEGELYHGVIKQTFDNDILPLSPELHKALDNDELWFNAMEPSATWLCEKRMPAALIVRQEMGPKDGLRQQTHVGDRQDVLPSLFAASCKTLLVRTASRRLWAAFVHRAGQVVCYREQQKRAAKASASSKGKQPRRFGRPHASSSSSSAPSSDPIAEHPEDDDNDNDDGRGDGRGRGGGCGGGSGGGSGGSGRGGGGGGSGGGSSGERGGADEDSPRGGDVDGSDSGVAKSGKGSGNVSWSASGANASGGRKASSSEQSRLTYDEIKRRLPSERPSSSKASPPILADNLFPHGAGYFPPTPDNSQPNSRTASGSSAKATMGKSTSSGSVSSLAPVQESVQMSPTQHFEQWWTEQDANIAGQEARRWVLDLRKVAMEALERDDAECSLSAQQQFRLVARGCHTYLVSGCSVQADTDAGLNFAGCCQNVGVAPQALAFALHDYCALHSFHQAEETFNALCSDFDGQVFYHAWPVLLSREGHLLAQ